MFCKNIIAIECQLAEMKLSSEGEAATNEPNNAFRSGLVELEEAFNMLLIVASN